MHAPAITFEVANRFHSLRRRYLAARLIACLCFGGAALLLGWMALVVCDYVWELPLVARRALMVSLGVIVGASTLWRSILILSDARSGRFVARLERNFELLGQRLRTLLETVDGRWRAPEAMLSALGHQTLGRWETVQPAQVIPRRLVVAATCCAGFMACVALAGFFLAGDEWRTAMLRALGGEVPYTQLVVAPGDARLLEGAELSVRLELQGRTNRDCMLRHRSSDSSDWTETTLQPLPDQPQGSASFVANLGKINHSIEYQFVTSVGTTRAYTVTMQPLIEVQDFTVEVTPPEYTRLASRTFSTAELSVLQGSQVRVTLKTNHPLGQVELQVGQSDKTLTAAEAQRGDDPQIWTFALPTGDSLQWHFAGSGEDGTPMKPLRGRLNVRHDQPPRLEWQEPLDELTVHMLAEVPMQVQISDDYGVSEAGIVFQLGNEEFVLKQWPLESDESAASPRDSITTRLRLSEVLPLESFSLSEKDFVAYYAFANDNRAGSPQHVESEVRYVDIRPLKQFFSELDLPPQGRPGKGVPGLDEIIRRERFLINRTRTLARSASAAGPERIGTIERMVESQSELADLTRFLMEFLISRGTDDTESLSQAEATMLQAADSLSSGDFDTALVQEQDALRFLAEARRTLEIVLPRRSTAQQRQALQRFRREMQQRLRRNVQTDAKLADTLKQIAAEQMQLAVDAEKIVPNPTAPSSQPGSPSPSPAKPASNGPSGNGPSDNEPSDYEPSGNEPAEPAENQPADANAADAESASAESASAEAADAESASAKAADVEPSSDGEAPPDAQAESNEATEATANDRAEQLHARQQELLDRLTEIDAGLSSEVKRSELATERMQQAIGAMDELVTDASQQNWSGVPDRGKELAGQLRELASHIDALAQGEPAKRVAAVRDMTTSLANLEGELADAELSVAAAVEQAAKPNAKRDANPAASGDAKSAGDTIDQLRDDAASISRRLERRAETLTDVLAQPVATADLTADEVYEQIRQLAEQERFADKLAESLTALDQPNSQKETAAWADAAMNRATEYADVAARLEALYRQLVTPRLDNLRRLESKASALVQVLNAELKGKGSGGEKRNKDSEKPPTDKPVGMLEQELEQELMAAGLEDLAEQLRGGEDETESEEDESARSEGSDESITGGKMSERRFSFSRLKAMRGRVIRVDRQLQEILRDLILSEISADQNMPVPPEYKELVDRYFRSLSGAAPAMEVTK